MNQRNIAIVGGGDSSEYIISINSTLQIQEALSESHYNIYPIILRFGEWYYEHQGERILIDKNDFSLMLEGQKIIFDLAFIAIHGTPGEDGKFPAYLEMVNIPYTCCDPVVSGITFRKNLALSILREKQVKVAKSELLRKGEEYNKNEILQKTGLPCFVKPNQGGSSFGISRVNRMEDFDQAIENAFKEDREILVEEFLDGIEITCGLIKTRQKDYIFPITEIVSKNEFFDYEAKYTDGMADEITPARIPDALAKECQDLSSQIYDLLNCKGLVRIDYIYSNASIYFLEVNTVPGLSKNSIVPKQVRTYGKSTKDLFEIMIEDALHPRLT